MSNTPVVVELGPTSSFNALEPALAALRNGNAPQFTIQDSASDAVVLAAVQILASAVCTSPDLAGDVQDQLDQCPELAACAERAGIDLMAVADAARSS